MADQNKKYAGAQMLVRRPVAEVFESFMDPDLAKNFWFTKGSGRLQVNKSITWEWEMYGVSTTVVAKEITPYEKIVLEWHEPPTTVEFRFRPLTPGSTYVEVMEWGYPSTGDELLRIIRDSTGGFTTVLDGLKAFMEHGIRLNLIADKFPEQVNSTNRENS
jgi:uncharacterized protein YndB with AHSA1/START domain